MKLTFDIGNTRTKTALFDGAHLLECNAFQGDCVSIGNAMEAYVDTVCRHHEVTEAVACCVGTEPDWNKILPKGMRLTLLNAESRLPFIIDYKTPSTLGADRLAVALGAWSRYPDEDILVVDAGSCITLESITSDGVYHGGVIMPGINMRLKAMNSFTARLPLLTFEGDEVDPLGKSTDECMMSGAAWGALLEIEGFVNRLHPKRILLTGGDADWTFQQMQVKAEICPNLLMEGLNLLSNEK